MAARIRQLISRQPVGGTARRVLFGLAAVLLLASELFLMSTVDGGTTAGVASALAVSIALSLTGWLPVTGGLCYVSLTVLVTLLPSNVATLSFSFIGLYLIAADWISRAWVLPAIGIITVVDGVQLLESNQPSIDILQTVFGAALALVIGTGARWNGERMRAAAADLAKARRQAEEARSSLYSDLSNELHDSVASELVHAIVYADDIERGLQEGADRGPIRHVADSVRMAMAGLRAIMITEPRRSGQTEPLSATVQKCRAMLLVKSISFECEIPVDARFGTIPSRSQRLVQRAVKEGATNVLKWAPESSAANLTIDLMPSGLVLLAMTNRLVLGSLEPSTSSLSNGLGLALLRKSVEEAGGELDYGTRGDSWMLTLRIGGRNLNGVAVDG